MLLVSPMVRGRILESKSSLRRSSFFYLPAGICGALFGAYLQSTLEWILKQQINFMWLMILFAFISFLNRHGRELMEQEQTFSLRETK